MTGSAKEYRFWQVGSWRPGHRIPRERSFIAGVMAFSPDSSLLAIAYSTDEVRVIDPATGRQVATLAAPDMQGAVNTLAFSRDGSALAVASGAGHIIHVWDLRAIRQRLAEMGLDWGLPRYPEPSASHGQTGEAPGKPLQVDLDLGVLNAREKYSLVLAWFPFHAEAYYRRGLAYVQFGQRAEAFADFNTALALQPDHAGALYQRGLIHARHARFQEAAADFSRVIAGNPGSIDAFAERGYAYLGLSQWAKAAADFSQALVRRPRESELWHARGMAQLALGEWRRAAADFSRLIDLEPACALGWEGRGLARANLGEWQAAVEDCTRALELKPGTAMPTAHLLAFIAPAERQAVASGADTRALTPNRPSLLATRAAAYANLRQWDKAAADWSALPPDNPLAFYPVALARLGAGDAAGYRRACAEMLRRFGRTDNPEVAHWVAWTLVLAPDAVQDRDRAARLAEQVLRGQPKNDQYVLTLGAALYRAGRWTEAVSCLERAARAPATEPAKPALYSPAYAWFFLAMAHQRLGHAAEARRWLDRAVTAAEQELREPNDTPSPVWNRRLTLHLLRREAEALVKPQRGAGRPASAGGASKPPRE